MLRRRFLGTAGLAAAALAAPFRARAQAPVQPSGPLPELHWRLASSFPKSLDTLFGGAEHFCKRLAEMSEGRFQVRPFAAGEIVPGLQVLDAVGNATVEMGQTASYYYIGKSPAFAFGTSVPFGLNTRQQDAWVYQGGGLDLLNEFYAGYNVFMLPFGHTGAQMGGWFRKEVKSLDDLKGLKFRIAGLAGQVFARLGAVPQQIAGGDVYPALEKGTIDAAEWVGPYDDEKLGFYKIAKYYYYPGWWEGCAMGNLFINEAAWKSLPPAYQSMVRSAAAEGSLLMLAKYDTWNAEALRRLAAHGTQLRVFPRDVLAACYKATFELYEDIAEQTPAFAKLYEPWKKFREQEYLWFRVAEQGFDNFVFTEQARVKG